MFYKDGYTVFVGDDCENLPELVYFVRKAIAIGGYVSEKMLSDINRALAVCGYTDSYVQAKIRKNTIILETEPDDDGFPYVLEIKAP